MEEAGAQRGQGDYIIWDFGELQRGAWCKEATPISPLGECGDIMIRDSIFFKSIFEE